MRDKNLFKHENAIRLLREEAGLSQKELANIVGVHPSVISRYEYDRLKPTSDMLKSLAKALNTTVGKLLKEDNYNVTESRSIDYFYTSEDMMVPSNSDLFLTALEKAKECDLCHSREDNSVTKDKKYYYEPHFVNWLRDGGTATEDNLVILCPNCHKKVHMCSAKYDDELLKILELKKMKNKKKIK